MMHLNISSLTFHFKEFHDFITKSQKLLNFDFIAITESRIKANSPPLSDITIPNYTIEHTPTESGKGGALLYISLDHNYKVRKDLNIYKSKELESLFIEVINKTGKKTV